MLEGVTRRRLALPERGVEIALLDWGGRGPLALLHHANGFCGAMWDLVAQPLREYFRVVAVDARGHGDSSRPAGDSAYAWENFGADLAAVAESLVATCGAGRPAIGIGHSFGGTAMILAAVARPELFERLVLVDPIAMPGNAEELSAIRRRGGSSLADRARRRRAVWPDRQTARGRWHGRNMFADWDERALDLYVAEALADRPDGQVELKCSPRIEAAVFEHSSRLDAMSLAKRLSVPTLVLWANGGSFPLAHFEDLAGRMQDGRVRELDAGHLAPMEDPALVLEEVLAFSVRSDDPPPSTR